MFLVYAKDTEKNTDKWAEDSQDSFEKVNDELVARLPESRTDFEDKEPNPGNGPYIFDDHVEGPVFLISLHMTETFSDVGADDDKDYVEKVELEVLGTDSEPVDKDKCVTFSFVFSF